MFLKKIFSGNTLSKALDLSGLLTDIHSHLIPGIDDGAQNLEDSLNLIRHMHKLGYKKLITTPHIQQEYYRNTPDMILAGLDHVRHALKAENIPVDIEAAAEYLIDDGFEEKMKTGRLLSFSDKFILVELSYYNPHPDYKSIIFNLQVDGYKVILAHPERYTYWFNTFDKFEDLKDRGVYFQLNLVSLAGYYPEPIKKFASRFIDQGMIDFLGSDLHNMRYMDAIGKAVYEKSLAKLLSGDKLLNNKL
jgi:protein-tyrosine phosphatase